MWYEQRPAAHLVDPLDHARARVAVVLNDQEHSFPLFEHLVQRHLDGVLLGGRLGDLLHRLQLRPEVELERVRQRERVVGHDALSGIGGDALPVPRGHPLGPQRRHDRHVRLEGGHLLLDLLGHVGLLVEAVGGEELGRLDDGQPHGRHVFFDLLSVEHEERPVEPLGRLVEPLGRRHPEVLVPGEREREGSE